MTSYLKALRLPIVLLSGLLCLVSFKISQAHHSALLPIIFTILLAGTCMVQNDWRDRKHDVNKGKNFAIQNEIQFLIFLVVLWLITMLLAVMLCRDEIKYCWIAIGGILSGFIYSEIRKIPILPALLVALASAAPVLFPVAVEYSVPALLLFLCTFFLIFGREIIKDLDDVKYDSGYKWTLPISVGFKKATSIAIAFIMISCMLALVLSLKALPGVILISVSALYLMKYKNHNAAKKLIDAGVLLILAILLFFGI